MAQAGYTPILIYASGTATNIPTSGNLISGSSGAELAINYADGKLYYKDGSGNVKLLSIGYGSSSVTPTNGGVQYGTGTALALTAAGSSGQILRSNGAAAPTWADLSTLGVNTISFGTTGLTPNSATAGAVTVAGTLVTANGGTGLGGATPFTANGVLYASSASALTSGSALTFSGSQLNVNGSFLTQSATILPASGAATLTLIDPANRTLQIKSPDSLGNQATIQTTTNHEIVFGINSAEQMRLTSTGLGIGTSSPAAKLDVRGNTYIQSNSGFALTLNPGVDTVNTKFGITFTTPTYSGGIAAIRAERVGATDAGQLLFYTSPNGDLPNLRATLDPSGNLGLGVTPSAWGGTFKVMQFAGGASIGGTTDPSLQITQNAYYNGTNWIYSTTAAASNYYQSGGAHTWRIAGSGTAGNAITFTQAMTLDASGNLSVGTTTIATQITFAGSSGITYQRSTDNTFAGVLDYLKSRGSAASPTAVQNGDDLFVLRVAPYHGSAYTYLTNTVVQVDGTFTSGQNPPTRIAWYTNAANGGSTERARITSGGDFQLGTGGTASANVRSLINGSSTTGYGGYIEFQNNGSAFAAVGDYKALGGGGSTALLLCKNSTGGVYLATSGATSWSAVSDENKKNIIENISDAAAKVSSLRAVIGTYKDDPNAERHPFLIAQDVQAVLPEAVTDNEGVLGLSYSDVIPLLVAAIKEQQALITSLTARVALLEGN